MNHFSYYRRTFLADVKSNVGSYIIAEVENSNVGIYALGNNMLTIADCYKEIELEFFLGSVTARRRSLTRAKRLLTVLTNFRNHLADEIVRKEKRSKRIREI